MLVYFYISILHSTIVELSSQFEIQFSNFLGTGFLIIDQIEKKIPHDELEIYFKFIIRIFKGE